MSKPLVSIIIVDYKENNPYLLESFRAISQQSYQNYEIILVTDQKNNLQSPKLTKKFYGKYVGPAQKRDDGAKMAKGEILVFLDDDAFPVKSWLKTIVRELQNLSIVAVGGPGVTPPGVSWQEEASGWASASPLGSGKYLYRFLPQKRQSVDDFPSMNLAVRKKDFLKVGGFDSNYWPGEDTKLCLDLVHKLNKKIIYSPKAQVFHHRRPIMLSHLRQNGNFGLHRGFFARALPQTSLKLIYFLPSLFLLALLLSPVIYILNTSFLTRLFNTLLASYLLALVINSFWIYSHSQKAFQAILSIPIIFLTHLWYGARFLQGLLFTSKLVR